MATDDESSRGRKRGHPEEPDFAEAFLHTLEKHLFAVFNVCEGVNATGPPGCAVRDNVIHFWLKHFVRREAMLEVYDQSVYCSTGPIHLDTTERLKYLYLHNGTIKLPFTAAQATTRALRYEVSPQHCLFNVNDPAFGEIEHYMDPEDSSHPKYSEVSGLEFPMFSRDGQRTTLSQGIANNQTLAFFVGRVYLFLKHLGIDENRLQIRQLPHNEMTPGAADCWIVEIKCSYGWVTCVRITHGTPCAHNKKVITPNEKELIRAFEDDHKIVCKELEELDFEEATEMKYDLEREGQVEFEVETLQKTVSLTKAMVSMSTKAITSSLIKLSFCIGKIISCVYEHSFSLGKHDENQQLCVFRFTPLVAPIKCAISITDPNYKQLAIAISEKLEAACVVNKFSGESMGHVRTDELGVPFAVIVDSTTSVTVRERDTNEKIKLAMNDVVAVVKDLTYGRYTWDELVLSIRNR